MTSSGLTERVAYLRGRVISIGVSALLFGVVAGAVAMTLIAADVQPSSPGRFYVTTAIIEAVLAGSLIADIRRVSAYMRGLNTLVLTAERAATRLGNRGDAQQ